MWLSNWYKYFAVVFAFVAMACSATETLPLKADKYVLTYEDDAQSEQWATYMYNHMIKRTTAKNKVSLLSSKDINETDADELEIHWRVNAEQEHDYCIDRENKTLHISVKNKEVAVWMVYQVIEKIAQSDTRFKASDLAPASISFTTQCSNFDFEYREPYYRPNLALDAAPIFGNNNVETDWGIWGHNLTKITKDIQDDNIYAWVNGSRNSSQLCFSSPELYTYLSEYIIDNYGEGNAQFHSRFMLSPQDNDIVCMCAKCVAAGNVKQSASAAVVALLNKLAAKFANHEFFVIAYRTTNKVPPIALAKNSGVFISTIDVVKGVDLQGKYAAQPQTKTFVQQVEAWKAKTTKVYIWDYSSNFDDYLSPLPSLYSLQKQLVFYKKIGVQGVFLNASGYDYAAFEDVQTYVASALLKNTTISVDILVTQYFKKYYPKSGHLLTEYYLQLEKQFEARNKPYDIYGSMQSNLKTYLNQKEFVAFYDALGSIVEETVGDERQRLTTLYTALTFTRMQIAYINGSNTYGFATKHQTVLVEKPIVKMWLSILQQAKSKGIISYKEAGGNLDNYCLFWHQLISPEFTQNLILGSTVDILTANDNIGASYLSDGVIGFDEDYHIGWYIDANENIHSKVSTANLKGVKRIQLRFLLSEAHRFVAPTTISFWSNGNELARVKSEDLIQTATIAQCDVALDLTDVQNLEVKFTRAASKRAAIACDEIRITNAN